MEKKHGGNVNGLSDFDVGGFVETRPDPFDRVQSDPRTEWSPLFSRKANDSDRDALKEEVLVQSRWSRIDDKMEALGLLAGGIAHSFNNLLMAIQGRASLALANIEPHDPVALHLKEIETHVKSASELTGQLLGLARKGKYDVVPADINQLISDAKLSIQSACQNILFQLSFQEDVWPVTVDKAQMRQAFQSLFTNAAQAMPGGGSIHINTENVPMSRKAGARMGIAAGKYVKVSISDSGEGIDAAALTKIFDPFYSTREGVPKNGLGLAAAYGIVKNHDGIIIARSQGEEGTRFIVYLPASIGATAGESAKYSRPIEKGGKILLIDDEVIITDVGKEILEILGYSVITANSGAEGVALYETHGDAIALVILDMMMPEMDGLAVFNRLKTINPDIKVLLSSGYSLDGKTKELLLKGCIGFIQKPFSINMLSLKLNAFFQGE